MSDEAAAAGDDSKQITSIGGADGDAEVTSGPRHEVLTHYLGLLSRVRDENQAVARFAGQAVADVMTAPAASVSATASFDDVVNALVEADASAVPVIDDDGMVLGVVSEADLLAGAAAASPGPSDASGHGAENHDIRLSNAERLMTRPAIAVTALTSLSDAAKLAAGKRVKRLPVLDEGGRLIGVISRSDLLRAFSRDRAMTTITSEYHHG